MVSSVGLLFVQSGACLAEPFVSVFVLYCQSTSLYDRSDVFVPEIRKLLEISWKLFLVNLTGICVVVIVAPENNATFGLGGLMPSIMVSLVTNDCRRSGRLLCNFQQNICQLVHIGKLIVLALTFRNPTRHGCGAAFKRFSNFLQKSSGPTFASTSS